MKRSIRIALITAASVAGLIGYTRVIWLSGFDQGGDVVMCMIASLQNDGKLATDDPGCKRAEAYKGNPLWMLRRRGEVRDGTA